MYQIKNIEVRYPDRITLIRGNHKSREITEVFGFYDECLRKFGSLNLWRYCTEIFQYLPLAAIIEGKIFCVHGGLSPFIKTLDEIIAIDRKQDVPPDGVICDLLQTEPDDEIEGCEVRRGTSYIFGGDVIEEFNRINNIDLICRAHQKLMEGYKNMFNDQLTTVWSAPNYCYSFKCGNIAAILELDEHLQKSYKTFEAAKLQNIGDTLKEYIPEYFL